MKSRSPLDIEMFPPFMGFPQEGISFLKKLKKNNTREWFGKHKADYEEFVKLPMQSLIASLQFPMAKLAPELEVNPKRSMFRIHRDTRFSKNKAPYKTHVAAVFHVKGNHWEHSAGYYVHIEPDMAYVGGGIYMPDGQQLKLIRTAIVDNPKEFLSIVSDDTFVKRFKTLEGEKLQRVPLGFPKDHMMADWLKFKSFHTGTEMDVKDSFTPKFTDKLMKVYGELLPLIRFLNRSLGI